MTTDTTARTERYLIDRQRILDTVTLSCRALDRHDADLLRRVFTTDAQLETGDWSGTPDALAERWSTLGADTLADAHHLTTHTCDRSDDGDSAVAESYVLRMSRLQDGETVAVRAVRFLDRLVRDGDAWRIGERRLVHDWSFTADGRESALDDGYERGTRDRDDLSYMRPLALTEAQRAALSQKET